ITSLFCSASTTASCTHFITVSKSTISPLRTPRDGVWPTPRILTVPSGRLSPTTTQILDVPISRPIIKLPLAIFVSPSFGVRPELLCAIGPKRGSRVFSRAARPLLPDALELPSKFGVPQTDQLYH